MMIVSIATGIGLQQKIRQKVSAFNGHIIISGYNDNNSDVSTDPVSIHQDFYPKFKTVDGITHVQAVASKAGIIRTENAFEGIIFKGVGKDYQVDGLKEYLVQGSMPDFKSSLNEEVLISKYLCNRLGLKLGDKFVTYFMKENSEGYNLRNFKIVGIYDSGFQEFDASYVIDAIINDVRYGGNEKIKYIAGYYYINGVKQVRNIAEADVYTFLINVRTFRTAYILRALYIN
jgi:lipoprotein-releasing system permease protein